MRMRAAFSTTRAPILSRLWRMVANSDQASGILACAGMSVEERARVDLSTLSALASRVSDALGKSVASRAGWVPDDQDGGQPRAR